MAKNTTLTCNPGVPTRITDTAQTAARAQANHNVHLLATTNTTAPVSTEGSVQLLAHMILTTDTTLASLFPGVGSTLHLWIWPTGEDPVDVSISHA